MKISAKNRIISFCDALGARRPSPGGGAAAALTGAVGAALIIKVANFTIGKKKYKKYEKKAKSIARKATSLRDRLNAHIEKDAKVYNKYAETRSQDSLKRAAACVAEIAKLSKDAGKLCGILKKIGTRHLKGDLYVAEALLSASERSADNLVRLNKKRIGR
ncbi:MAG: cyclodeaminase/cyclohydrolase family protein [Candidatus Omnitrophota bacterium]|nr:cyclodeaminase/cyclohydrolase family protein [Candidatus Omnitrophota bacterium]